MLARKRIGSGGLRSLLEHRPVGAPPGRVHTGHDLRRAPPEREPFAGGEQPSEPGRRLRTGPGGAELHETDAAARLRPRADVAHRERHELPAGLDEDGVAELLALHGTDLARHVEPVVDPAGEGGAGRQGRRRVGHRREGDPAAVAGRHRLRQDRR